MWQLFGQEHTFTLHRNKCVTNNTIFQLTHTHKTLSAKPVCYFEQFCERCKCVTII